MKRILTFCLFIGFAQLQAQNCLLSYQTKLDELLPLTTILNHYKGDLSAAKLNYRKSEPRYAKRDTYEYVWESGRKRTLTIGGRDMQVPDDNRIGLAWIDEIDAKRNPDPITYFRNFYRTATEAEKQQAAALVDKKLKEKGTDNTDQTTGKVVSSTISNTKGYESIPGIGDAAAWDFTSSQLVVLKGRTTFKVTSLIGENVRANQELAIQFAKEVLGKCKF